MDLSISFNGRPLDNEGLLSATERPLFTNASMGMLLCPMLTPRRWEEMGHKMDEILRGNIETDSSFLEYCAGIELLTFADVVQVLHQCINKRYSKEFWIDAGIDLDNVTNIDIHFIKEGHTSSVWKLIAHLNNDSEPVVRAVNVSRDRCAAEDLWHSSELLAQIGRLDTNIPIADIYSKQKITLDSNTAEIVVTINRWIENASEIHLVHTDANEPPKIFAIDKFITDENEKARISQLYGNTLSDNDYIRVQQQLLELERTFSAAVVDNQLDSMPNFEINEGDLMWTGDQIIIVALSSPLISTDKA